MNKDVEYILRIILRARDEMSATLAKAAGELRAFEEATDDLDGRLDTVNRRMRTMSERARGLREELGRLKQASDDTGGSVERITLAEDANTAATEKNIGAQKRARSERDAGIKSELDGALATRRAARETDVATKSSVEAAKAAKAEREQKKLTTDELLRAAKAHKAENAEISALIDKTADLNKEIGNQKKAVKSAERDLADYNRQLTVLRATSKDTAEISKRETERAPIVANLEAEQAALAKLRAERDAANTERAEKSSKLKQIIRSEVLAEREAAAASTEAAVEEVKADETVVKSKQRKVAAKKETAKVSQEETVTSKASVAAAKEEAAADEEVVKSKKRKAAATKEATTAVRGAIPKGLSQEERDAIVAERSKVVTKTLTPEEIEARLGPKGQKKSITRRIEVEVKPDVKVDRSELLDATEEELGAAFDDIKDEVEFGDFGSLGGGAPRKSKVEQQIGKDREAMREREQRSLRKLKTEYETSSASFGKFLQLFSRGDIDADTFIAKLSGVERELRSYQSRISRLASATPEQIKKIVGAPDTLREMVGGVIEHSSRISESDKTRVGQAIGKSDVGASAAREEGAVRKATAAEDAHTKKLSELEDEAVRVASRMDEIKASLERGEISRSQAADGYNDIATALRRLRARDPGGATGLIVGNWARDATAASHAIRNETDAAEKNAAEIKRTAKAHDELRGRADETILSYSRLMSDIKAGNVHWITGRNQLHNYADEMQKLSRRISGVDTHREHQLALGVEEARGAIAGLNREQGRFARSARETDRASRGLAGVFNGIAHGANMAGGSVARVDNELRGMIVLAVMAFAEQFITVLMSLAGSLASVASSAIFAGGAFGGALVAGLAQAIPMLGLFVASFARVKEVMDAVNQSQLVDQQRFQRQFKNRKQQADTSDALANAEDGVKNAEDNLAQAHQRLADAQDKLNQARSDAVKQIRDLVAAEHDAELQARGAALAQSDAQEALRQAVAGGDVSGLAGAEQNVLESVQARREAVTGLQDARQAAHQATSGGVEGMQGVKDARRQVEDARRGVQQASDAIVKAQRAVTKAARGSDAATQDQFAGLEKLQWLLQKRLSPAERDLYQSINRLQKVYKQQFRPVTDIFIGEYTRGVNTAIRLLKDPRIINASKGMATDIAGQMERVRKSFSSNAFIDQVVRITRDGRKNLKPLTDILINLGHSFANIAEEAAPALHRLLGWFKDLSDRVRHLTENRTVMGKFFDEATKNALAWLDALVAIIKMLAALAGIAEPEGLSTIKELTAWANRTTENIKKNRDQVAGFFRDSHEVLKIFLSVLVAVGKGLLAVYSPDRLRPFADFLKNTLLPALVSAVQMVGGVTSVIMSLLSAPLISKVTQMLLTILLITKIVTSIRTMIAMMSSQLAEFFTMVDRMSFGQFNKNVDKFMLKPLGSVLETVGELLKKIPLLNRTKLPQWTSQAGKDIRTNAEPKPGGTAARVGRDAEGNLVYQDAHGRPVSQAPGGGTTVVPAGGAARKPPAPSMRDEYGQPTDNRYYTQPRPRNLPREPAGGGGGTTILPTGGLRAGAGGALSRMAGRGGTALMAYFAAQMGADMLGVNTSKGVGKGAMDIGKGAGIGFTVGGPAGAAVGGGLVAIKKEWDGLKADMAGFKGSDAAPALAEFRKEIANHQWEKADATADSIKRMTYEMSPEQGDKIRSFLQKAKSQMAPFIGQLENLRKAIGKGIDPNDIIDPRKNKNAVGQFTSNLESMRKYGVNSISDLRDSLRFNIKEINAGFVEGSKSWMTAMTTNFSAGIDAVKKGMRDGKISTKNGMTEIVRISRQQMRFMRDNMANLSDDARAQLAQNFADAAGAVGYQSDKIGDLTAKALSRVRKLLAAEFEAVGLSPDEARNLAKNRTTKGRQNLDQFGHPDEGGGGRAIGGRYGTKGHRGKDDSAGLGDGELVLNHWHERAINAMLPGQITAEDVVNSIRGFHAGGYGQRGFAAGGRMLAGVHEGVRKAAMSILGRFPGLSVTSTTGGGHAANSYHYKGEAVDIGGAPDLMNRAAAWIKRTMGRNLTEGIHNPNLSIKGGQSVPPSFWGSSVWGQHANHIHIAVAGALGNIIGGMAHALKRIKAPRIPGGGALGVIAQRRVDQFTRVANILAKRAQAQAGGGDTSDLTSLGGGAAPKKIYDYFIHRGLSPAQSAGIVGTFQKESGFSTTIGNRAGSGATGLAQWLGGRLSALKQKKNWTSLLTQLNFVWEELTGSERGALAGLRRAHTPEEAATIFDRLYERSDGLLSAPQYARAAFERFASKRAFGGPVPGYGGGDKHPVMLEGGEHVLTKDEVRNAGGHDIIFKLRKLLGGGKQGGPHGFAVGGAFDPIDPRTSLKGDLARLNFTFSTAFEHWRREIVQLGQYVLPSFPITSWDAMLKEVGRAGQALKNTASSWQQRVAILNHEITGIRKAHAKDIDDQISDIRKGGVTAKEAKRIRKLRDEDISKADKARIKDLQDERDDLRKNKHHSRQTAGISQRIKDLTAVTRDGGLVDMMDTLRQFRSAQRTRATSLARYKGGRQVMTDEQAAGRDFAASQSEVSDLGHQESTITRAQTAARNALRRLQRGGVTAAEAGRVRQLQTILTNLRQRYGDVRDNQATAQENLYTSNVARQQTRVDAINKRADNASGWLDRVGRVADAVGTDAGRDWVNAQRRGVAARQIADLTPEIEKAKKMGNVDLADQLSAQVDDLRTSILESLAADFKTGIDRINRSAERRSALIDFSNRLADVREKAGDAIGAARQRADNMGRLLGSQRGQRDQLVNAIGGEGALASLRTADWNSLTDVQRDLVSQIDDLDTTITENTQAEKDLNTAVRQASFDAISQRQQFRGGVFGGLQTIMQNLGQLAGATPDTQRQLGLARKQGADLEGTGQGYANQLLAYGIDVRGQHGTSLVDTLSSLNYDGIESNMSAADKTLFESLIQSVVDNEGALIQNTQTIQTLDGTIQQPQQWQTTAWQWFRQAIFNGMGGLLPQYQIPGAATGGIVQRSGLAYVHSGEPIVPAHIADAEFGGKSNYDIDINYHEVADSPSPLETANRVVWELKTANTDT